MLKWCKQDQQDWDCVKLLDIQSHEREKYSHESCGTWKQELLCWWNQQQFTQPDLAGLSKRELHDSQGYKTVKYGHEFCGTWNQEWLLAKTMQQFTQLDWQDQRGVCGGEGQLMSAHSSYPQWKGNDPTFCQGEGPISKHIKDLVRKVWTRNQDWLCWKRLAAIYLKQELDCSRWSATKHRSSKRNRHCKKLLQSNEYVKTHQNGKTLCVLQLFLECAEQWKCC
jgi:hypothetical protein